MILNQVEILPMLRSRQRKLLLCVNNNHTYQKSWQIFLVKLIPSDLQYIWFFSRWFAHSKNRASDISRGHRPVKFRYFRQIPRNSPKNAKYCEIRQKYFQIHVGKTYLTLILAIRPVLFIPNIQIYLETLSMQWVNNVPKLPKKG